jgi:aspartate carbamoyltransferase catalytic subunit
VDATAHAHYFTQAANGIPVRQAILALVLGAVP